ncbi:SDR family NAD(P)-dependent oxidoreductase [Streptomyces nitrosporeus]|uniref:SDR family NAD(P)-dependent oxidoreductase n=1 Tax=Streptomyces nitrosporeus TaxID=28894 RepID=UPI00244E00CE|nr:SDR family oxidoreductase [Streptomyces nitrosporeus]
MPATAPGRGRAAALRFAAEGALVVAGDPSHEEAVETRRLIAREGGTALVPGPLDPADEASVRGWVEEAADAFGGIDIVHTRAGLRPCASTGRDERSPAGPGAERPGTGRPDEERPGTDRPGSDRPGADRPGADRPDAKRPDAERPGTDRPDPLPMDLLLPVVRPAWPHLVRSRGCVVVDGSAAGPDGPFHHRGTALLRPSGDAVVALTRRLAAEGAPYGIRVNCVGPGVFGTGGSRAGLPVTGRMPTGGRMADSPPHGSMERLPLSRAGEAPEDVAAAAVFLASGEAAHLTGVCLTPDGAWSVLPPDAMP